MRLEFIADNDTRGEETNAIYPSLNIRLRKIRATTAAITLGVLAGAATPALADNPLGLIDPATISVGTMGDAKPYAFTTADGNFTGFDIELFLNVAERLGFKKEQVVFTGENSRP